MHRDFIGNELAVCDTVIYIKNEYREFVYGKVIRLGAKRVTIKPLKRGRQTVRDYNTVVKVKGEI